MNQLEIEALQTPISHLARTLYCGYLRPNLTQTTLSVIINNKLIIELLNNKEVCITKGREVNDLFRQLHNVGLIELGNNASFDSSLHKKEVKLPLTKLPHSLSDPEIHSAHKAMQISWRPNSDVFDSLCKLVGLIDNIYTADELGEFIAYWLGRIDSQCTEYQWTQKLVIHLKQRRLKVPLAQQQTQAGHQYVTPTAGIVFDDNVKKLVDKYKEHID